RRISIAAAASRSFTSLSNRLARVARSIGLRGGRRRGDDGEGTLIPRYYKHLHVSQISVITEAIPLGDRTAGRALPDRRRSRGRAAAAACRGPPRSGGGRRYCDAAMRRRRGRGGRGAGGDPGGGARPRRRSRGRRGSGGARARRRGGTPPRRARTRARTPSGS